MTSEEIKKVLDLHKKWLNNEDGGERANLRWADLSCVNLSGAKLRGADLRETTLRLADLRWADLRETTLRLADLRGVNLTRADLRGADLDLSCFPLWCGGSQFKCDTKLVYQLLAHICTLDFPDDEGIKALIMPFAVKSHRAVDLGLKEKSE
jgi:hypothetical protein